MLDKVQLDTPGLRVICKATQWTGTMERLSDTPELSEFFLLPMVRWDVAPLGCVEHNRECLEELTDE